MENWQGVPSELKQDYSVVHMIKRTAEKELVLLQHRTTGQRVLLRNYTGSILPVYQLLKGKTVSHVPRIYEAETRPGGYYVLEEFIEGHKLTPGTFSDRELMSTLDQICEALSGLHELGVVHRDVKPDNLIQTEDGTVYLLDLDAGRLYKQYIEHDTCTLGTAGFAAPEQFGIVQTDYKADIFALGITLNILKTGAHPSDQLCGGWLRRVVLKCTRIDPRTRYQTAKSVWRAAWVLSLLFPDRKSKGILNGIAAAAVILLLCGFGLHLTEGKEENTPDTGGGTAGQLTEELLAPERSGNAEPEATERVGTTETAAPKPDAQLPDGRLDSKPEPEPELELPDIIPKPKPGPDPAPEPDPPSEPEPGPKPEIPPKPDEKPKPPEVIPEQKPEPRPKPEIPSKPEPRPKPPEVIPEPEPEPKPEPVPEPNPPPAPEPDTQEGYAEVAAAHAAYMEKSRELRKAIERYSECKSMPYYIKNEEYQDAYNQAEICWKECHVRTVECRETLESLQAAETRDKAAIAAAQAEYDRAAAEEERAGQELASARESMTAYQNTSEYLRGKQEEEKRYREYQKLNNEAGELLVQLNDLEKKYGIHMFIPNE